MELHNFVDARPRNDPLRAHIGRLIEVVGTPKFEPEVFRLARSAINCEHLTAFAVSDKTPPRVLFAGVPGKVLRELRPDEAARVAANSLSYVEYARRYRAGQLG